MAKDGRGVTHQEPSNSLHPAKRQFDDVEQDVHKMTMVQRVERLEEVKESTIQAPGAAATWTTLMGGYDSMEYNHLLQVAAARHKPSLDQGEALLGEDQGRHPTIDHLVEEAREHG
jgi:hypothetical protein